MFTKNDIIKEVNELPADRLEEVYDFVHSLSSEAKQKKIASEKILSFGGAFSDMTQIEYTQFKKQTKKVRADLFDRNISL